MGDHAGAAQARASGPPPKAFVAAAREGRVKMMGFQFSVFRQSKLD